MAVGAKRELAHQHPPETISRPRPFRYQIPIRAPPSANCQITVSRCPALSPTPHLLPQTREKTFLCGLPNQLSPTHVTQLLCVGTFPEKSEFIRETARVASGDKLRVTHASSKFAAAASVIYPY